MIFEKEIPGQIERNSSKCLKAFKISAELIKSMICDQRTAFIISNKDESLIEITIGNLRK